MICYVCGGAEFDYARGPLERVDRPVVAFRLRSEQSLHGVWCRCLEVCSENRVFKSSNT